jgi:hypothetical protein
MNFRNAGLKKRLEPLNVIRMAFVLCTMPIRAALNGWRSSFMRRGREAGNWFNPDTTTGNSFVYGRREKVQGRRAEKIHSL